MIRTFAVSYQEHLAFTPPPAKAGTRDDPDAVEEQPPVDTWRTGTKHVAVTDGDATAAIERLTKLLEETEDHVQQRVTEVQIIGVALVSEAE